MAWSEILEFDSVAYAKKLKDLTPEQLLEREVKKERQKFAASAKIGGGVGLAPWTGGASLVSTGLGSRQMWIANRKLDLVHEELKSRGIDLYKPTTKDALVPLAITIGTLGIGHGISDLAVHATSEVSASAVSAGGYGLGHALVESPGTFAHAVGSGMECQLHEVETLFTGGYHDAVTQALSDSNIWLAEGANAADPGQLIAAAHGMFLYQDMENYGITFGIAASLRKIFNTATGDMSPLITKLPPPKSCRRIQEPTSNLACGVCGAYISRLGEVFYHCCDCNDNLDLCANCANKGRHFRSCQHVLYELPCFGIPKTEGMKVPVSYMSCDTCGTRIAQQSYYRCNLCNNGDFEICESCYKDGKRCLNTKHTILYLCFETREAGQQIAGSLYTCVRSMFIRTNPDQKMTCTLCSGSFRAGDGYIHCCACDADNFDVCKPCFLTNFTGCHDSTHILTLVRPNG